MRCKDRIPGCASEPWHLVCDCQSRVVPMKQGRASGYVRSICTAQKLTFTCQGDRQPRGTRLGLGFAMDLKRRHTRSLSTQAACDAKLPSGRSGTRGGQMPWCVCPRLLRDGRGRQGCNEATKPPPPGRTRCPSYGRVEGKIRWEEANQDGCRPSSRELELPKVRGRRGVAVMLESFSTVQKPI